MQDLIAIDLESLDRLVSSVVSQAADRIIGAQEKHGGLRMARAWVYQRPEQVRSLGEDKAPWYVRWYDPEGAQRSKSFGRGAAGKRLAKEHADKVHAQLVTHTYRPNAGKTWSEFRQEYEALITPNISPRTLREIRNAFSHFERLVSPKSVQGVTAEVMDRYGAKRLLEGVTPATANKEMRHIKAAFKRAKKWGFSTEAPEVQFLREPKRIPCYMPPEDFARLYDTCDQALYPTGLPCSAADWWRGMLMLLFMTGWRINQALALRRADVNLETGEVFSHAEDTKGNKDVKLMLHPLAVEHLKRVPGFHEKILHFPQCATILWREFRRLQDVAGVHPERKAHYGFHDLRRAFATMNADRMSADALQRLMGHADYKTTQRYLNLARQLKPATENLYVPPIQGKTG